MTWHCRPLRAGSSCHVTAGSSEGGRAGSAPLSPHPGELLAGGQRAEALLACDNDLCVLGDLGLHVRQEALVRLHVGAAQPPAATAKEGGDRQAVSAAAGRYAGSLAWLSLLSLSRSPGGGLLQKVAQGHLVVDHEERNGHGAVHGHLAELLGRAHIQQHPALLRSPEGGESECKPTRGWKETRVRASMAVGV